jgi:hypothetical protein
MANKIKQVHIPVEFTEQFKRAAAAVYSDVASDVPEIESYSKRAVVEIIRDANRISAASRDRIGFTEEFRAWILKHEYDETYRADMNKLVIEAI